MDERKPEMEIADEDLDQATGGATPASTRAAATSKVMKANGDAQSGIAGNLKAS
jgi:hypothetical protein